MTDRHAPQEQVQGRPVRQDELHKDPGRVLQSQVQARVRDPEQEVVAT